MKFNTLNKSVEILDVFLKKHDMLNVAEISNSLKMPRSSIYKYLAALRKHGFVDYEKKTGAYKLGIKFLQYASLVRSQIRIDAVALPYMRKLANEVKETVILSILLNQVAYCVERVGYESGIIFSMQRGAHLPLNSGASAKVLLASLPDEEIDALLRETKMIAFTPNTITDRQKLKENLMKIRRDGYAYSDQEVDVGARAVAAPILNDELRLIAGLCVAGPVQRMDDLKIKKVTKLVIKYAKDISEDLTKQRKSG